jgi:hypothetical protein
VVNLRFLLAISFNQKICFFFKMMGFELKTLLRWSSYFFEISLMLGFISSSSHSRVKTMILCCSSTQWFFFFSQSCWTILRIFPATNQKYIQCFDVRWHASSLPELIYRSPPHRCSIITGCLCLLFKAFFILSMYWFIRVLAFHSDVSAVSIVGCPWWLLLSLLLKLDHASKCGVARFIIEELNKSSIF